MSSKYNTITIVMIYALAFLSVIAGIPKILQMPQELAFLSVIGLSGVAVTILGMAQSAAGILMFQRTLRLPGAELAALAFLISSVAIFASGDTAFGLVSLLPVLVSIIVIYTIKQGKRSAN